MADIVKYRFVLRRGLAADWTSKNEILLQGEFGLELDTDKVKIGDGTTAWNSLNYFGGLDGGINRQMGTNYTFNALDKNATVICSNSSPITLTVPSNTTTSFEIGTKIAYTQGAMGSVSIVGALGVTVHALNGNVTGAQFDGGVVEKIGTDEWQLWNGPALALVATTGSYNDLDDLPSIDAITSANEQAGTTYFLVLSDLQKIVRISNSSPITLTVPSNTTVAFPLYCSLPIFQGSSGIITIIGDSGVTIEAPNGSTTLTNGDFRVLFQRALNTWVIA